MQIPMRATGDAIPKSRIRDKILLYVKHISGDIKITKFLWQATCLGLCKQLPTILGTYLRPLAYKSILGNVGRTCLIERNVRLEVPSKIFLDDRVFVGESCWISAGSMEGEIKLGNDSFVAHRSTLTARGGKILIGEHVHISRNSYISGIGNVEIGKDSMLGPNVTLNSGNHKFADVDTPMRLQGARLGKITIENDVWLGANVCVVPGVTIGRGTVVGAGAVVTKDIPPYSIAVGVPAKVVRERHREH